MAGRIPQSFINDLLERIDIVAVIEARIDLKKAGKNYSARCPFHDEKTPSFSVSPDKQFYYCFGCGVSGTALTFLLEHDRLPFVEAVETLAAMAGVTVPREGGGPAISDRGKEERDRLLAAMEWAARFFRGQLRQAPAVIEYLRGRGLTGEIARDFAIGYAPDAWDSVLQGAPEKPEILETAGLVICNDAGRRYDRFRKRVIFPIRDLRGRVIAFGGRVLGADDGPKYLNSPETPLFQKHRELYGLYEARQALRQIDRFLVVEGYMDVVALAQFGISNAVATLGTACGETHLEVLFRYSDEVVCCFDGDAAGRQAAWRALERGLGTLKDGRQLRFMFLPDGEDPDSLVRSVGKDAFLDYVQGAVGAGEYLWRRLATGINLDEMDGRARFAGLAQPLIDRLPPGALERLLRGRLQELTGARSLPPSELPPQAAGTASGTARERGRVSSRGGRLSEHLLSILLREPKLLASLPDEELQLLAAQTDLFGRVLSDLLTLAPAARPLEPAALLGRWSGEADHEELLRVLERQPVLEAEALEKDFVQGCQRYVAMQRKAERGRLLEELGDEFDPDKLERYWALRTR